MISYQDSLKKAGLTGNESKVYLELLKKGKLSANQLAKNISMDRTLVYTILNNLIDKGLANYVINDKKKFFNAAEPENLLNSIKKQEIFVGDLISELSKIKKENDEPYEIKIFEGKEGFRAYVREVLNELPNELCSYGGTGKGYDLLYEFPRLAKEYSKHTQKIRQIMNLKYKKHPVNKLKGVQFRYLDVKSDATFSIYGNTVSIHLLTGKPIVIFIKNKEISQSFKEHFEFLWEIAKSN